MTMMVKVMTCFVIRYEISSEALMYSMVTVENKNVYLKFANIVVPRVLTMYTQKRVTVK